VKVKPLTTAPRRATLLNNGAPVDVATDMAPSDHLEQKGYLRLQNLPANEMANSVLVVKLEFDRPPESGVLGTEDARDMRRR
jgi:alpha-L-fucosidase